MDYAERVAQTANILWAGQVNSGILQESTMPYISVEPATIKIIREYVSVPYVQCMENTVASPILKSLAIPYQENQPVNHDL